MIYCEFIKKDENLYVCERCGAKFHTLAKKMCTPRAAPIEVVQIPGVGKRLGHYLHWFGIEERRDCGCEQIANRLDRLGPEGCRMWFWTIIDELESRAQKHKYFFNRLGARVLLNLAIYNTKKALQKSEKRRKGV